MDEKGTWRSMRHHDAQGGKFAQNIESFKTNLPIFVHFELIFPLFGTLIIEEHMFRQLYDANLNVGCVIVVSAEWTINSSRLKAYKRSMKLAHNGNNLSGLFASYRRIFQ